MGWTTRFSDSFTDSTAYVALSTHDATWVNDYTSGTPQRIDGTKTMVGSAGESRDKVSTSLGTKQSAQIKVYSASIGGNFQGPMIRYTSAGSGSFNQFTGYLAIFIDAGTIQIRRFDNGSNTTIASGSAALDATGRIFRLEADDSGVYAYWDGSLICNALDTTYTTGSAALACGAVIDGWGDDFVAQDYTTDVSSSSDAKIIFTAR